MLLRSILSPVIPVGKASALHFFMSDYPIMINRETHLLHILLPIGQRIFSLLEEEKTRYLLNKYGVSQSVLDEIFESNTPEVKVGEFKVLI